MRSFIFSAADLTESERLASAIAGHLPANLVIALSGTLGAGKTQLVQLIAKFLGIKRSDVVSPTFTLCNEYLGERKVFHLDLYRIQDEDEFYELGFADQWEMHDLYFVEWADKFVDALPRDRLNIDIEVTGETSREFSIAGTGAISANVVEGISLSLASPGL